MSAFKIIEYPYRKVYKSNQGQWHHRPSIRSNRLYLKRQRKKSIKSSIDKEKSKQQAGKSQTPQSRCYGYKKKNSETQREYKIVNQGVQKSKKKRLQYCSLPSIQIQNKRIKDEKSDQKFGPNTPQKGYNKTLDSELPYFKSVPNNPEIQGSSFRYQYNQNELKCQSANLKRYNNQEQSIVLLQMIQSKINNSVKREVNPLKLKTYFRIQRQRELDRQIVEKTWREQLNKNYTIPEIPHISKVSTFIKNYVPKNKIIKISDLIQQQNFESVHQEAQTGELKLYFGEISNEQMHGTGIMIQKNYIFEGTWIDNQKREGVQTTESGIYKGEFFNNERNGVGQFFWRHGDYYRGQWKNGKRNGNGYLRQKNGQSYLGHWSDDHLTGEGSKTQKDGSKYEGLFQNFQKHGFGKEIFPNGDKYQGLYRKGLPHGRGRYIWKQGFVYEGIFQQGLKHGEGKIMGKNSYQYNGRFQKDRTVGMGSIKYANGDTFKGEMSQNTKNGFGMYHKQSEKIIIKGFWKDDKLMNIQEQQEY